MGSGTFCSGGQIGSVEVGRGAGSGKFNSSLSNALLTTRFQKNICQWFFPDNPHRQIKIFNQSQQLLELQC